MGVRESSRTTQRPKRKSSLAVIVIKVFSLIMVATLILSGVFYRRIGQIANVRPSFETWASALDVSFAHATVTLPLLLVLGALISRITMPVLKAGMKVTRTVADLADVMPWWWQPLVPVGIAGVLLVGAAGLYAIYWVTRFLLVDTGTLQTLLFGQHDANLGWQYPTTFRFTLLSTHVGQQFKIITDNEVVAAILGFLGVAAGLIISLGAFAKALGSIEDAFRSR